MSVDGLSQYHLQLELKCLRDWVVQNIIETGKTNFTHTCYTHTHDHTHTHTHTHTHNGSWVNLKGGGRLTTKVGNGEQMSGMVSGLGSVSGSPWSTPR